MICILDNKIVNMVKRRTLKKRNWLYIIDNSASETKVTFSRFHKTIRGCPVILKNYNYKILAKEQKQTNFSPQQSQCRTCSVGRTERHFDRKSLSSAAYRQFRRNHYC